MASGVSVIELKLACGTRSTPVKVKASQLITAAYGYKDLVLTLGSHFMVWRDGGLLVQYRKSINLYNMIIAAISGQYLYFIEETQGLLRVDLQNLLQSIDLGVPLIEPFEIVRHQAYVICPLTSDPIKVYSVASGQDRCAHLYLDDHQISYSEVNMLNSKFMAQYNKYILIGKNSELRDDRKAITFVYTLLLMTLDCTTFHEYTYKTVHNRCSIVRMFMSRLCRLVIAIVVSNDGVVDLLSFKRDRLTYINSINICDMSEVPVRNAQICAVSDRCVMLYCSIGKKKVRSLCIRV